MECETAVAVVKTAFEYLNAVKQEFKPAANTCKTNTQ
jgi:hypothetical protein